MTSKLEPVIWLRVLVTLAYMKGWTDVMAIKPNFLASMGYQYFLSFVLDIVMLQRGVVLLQIGTLYQDL